VELSPPVECILAGFDPVALVRVVDEACGDAFGFEGAVEHESLCQHDSVVEFTVDHERWGHDSMRVGHRTPTLDRIHVLPWDTSNGLVPTRGVVRCPLAKQVGDAGVADGGGISVSEGREPAHEIPTVRTTSDGHAVLVDIAGREHVICCCFDIPGWHVTPRSVDRAGECVAE